MLVPKSVSFFSLVFKYKGTELPRTKARIAGVFLLSCLVTWAEMNLEDSRFHSDLHPLPFQLSGVALSIFLGFRNNAAYDRWWEGRKLWGRILNRSRSVARQALSLIGAQPGAPALSADEQVELAALQRAIILRTVAFAHATRLHLRDLDDLSELKAFLPPDEVERLQKESNRPTAILFGLAQQVRVAWQRGWLHAQHVNAFETSMDEFSDLHGGCERIKATPIPFSYTTLIHRIVAVYCYGLPFGLVSETGVFTPIVVLVVSYAFFGLDIVGDEIEQPFGTDPNDLPLSAISRMIEVNLRQRIGDTDIPPLLRPVDEILM